MRFAVLLCSLLGFVSSEAQESVTPVPTSSPGAPATSPAASESTASIRPTASPTPVPRNVVLRFALPPLEGSISISLGIYDPSGKLVRVLHREDTIDDFTAGHDALETSWDGTDDHGQPLPNGKYHARGYVVGPLQVEGVSYFFNDWVTDEKSPHIMRLPQLWMETGELHVAAELAGGKKTEFLCDQTTGALGNEVAPTQGNHCEQTTPPPNILHPIDCAAGKDGTTWFIDALDESGAREVKQLSKEHEVLRRLDYVGDDPRPEKIEVSPITESIFLIEQSQILQRLRGLALVRTTSDAAEGPVSDWKSLFDKKIIAHENFALLNDKPVAAAAAFTPAPEKITQTLQPNPLQQGQTDKVALGVGLDADGSFLKTSDGLPLRTISDTPHLSRALIARTGPQALDVFQDDGAVVEQFRISNLAQMNAFDCGDFELK